MVFAFSAAATKPQPLRIQGTKFCIGWTKGDCDGICLETVACDATTPTWLAQRGSHTNASHLRSISGSSCRNGCCIDYEDRVGHFQAFPACTEPLGNQALTFEPVGSTGVRLRAQFLNGGYVSVLGTPVPPPPAPIKKRPINTTLSGYWRPIFHPTGFGELASESIGHLQDPSAPFQDAAGLWHVFPDCTPETWNAGVLGPHTLDGAGKAPYLGWCHLTSPDLVRWSHLGPAVWFDDTTATKNGSGFSGNCGTGGGAVNSRGEFVAFCPHDGSGIYVFAAENSNNFTRLELSPRPQPGEDCTSAASKCAMTPPPPGAGGLNHVQPSDPGTPFMAADGRMYQVWGNRGDNASVFLYKAPTGDTSLRSFSYDKVLFSGGYAPEQFCHAYGPVWCHARVWAAECPDFMLIGERPLLLVSLGLGGFQNLPATAWWAAESWTPGGAFTPATGGMVDYGSFYAPKTASSTDGQRRIVFGWLTERWCDIGDEYNGGCTAPAPHTLPPIGWDGSQTLPRELSLTTEGQLVIKPVAETVLLRGSSGATPTQVFHLKAGVVSQKVTTGRALELRLNVSMPAAGSAVAMDVLASLSTPERTTILINGTTRKLSVVTAHSSLGPTGGRAPYMTPPLEFAEIELAVWVDHSAIEVFVNERIALTARAYPTAEDSVGVRLWSVGGDTSVSVASWQVVP